MNNLSKITIKLVGVTLILAVALLAGCNTLNTPTTVCHATGDPASPMHDVGKISIPDNILGKPGSLTADEWEVMKGHTTMGSDILGSS